MHSFQEIQVLLHDLIRQHDVIHEQVREATDAALYGRCDKQVVVEQLKRLSAGLKRHFDTDADGGCLEQASCLCPAVSSDAAQVERDHIVVLQKLDELIDFLQSEPSVSGDQLCREIAEFREALRESEQAEDKIFRRAFGTNLNVLDED